MSRYPRLMLIFILWITTTYAQADLDSQERALGEFNRAGDFSLIASQVVDQTTFYGLAAYFNGVGLYTVSADQVESLQPGQTVTLAEGEWFAAVGRFNVLILDTPGASLEIGEQTFTVTNERSLPLNARIVRKDKLASVSPELDQLRYHHLWWPFAQISRAIEWSLVQLKALSSLSWGITIVLFTVILKILLVPLGIITVRMQEQVSQNQTKLAPVLAAIKEKYDGHEAHNRIVAAHKELGVTTFFTLKPMLPMFIQIPIWVAVFNALGEMPQLDGQAFLWIKNLAYPDAIATLPTALPLLGDRVSLLPLLMTVVTILSAALTQDPLAPAEEQKRQKRNGYLIALSFLVLFYPFPAAMVLYWTLSNALQIVQQKMIKP
jgi:YidC/Oxa1 family membrane protein insertase